MGSQLSVSAEEAPEPQVEESSGSEVTEEKQHRVMFLTEEEAREPSKVLRSAVQLSVTMSCSGDSREGRGSTSRTYTTERRHQLELSLPGRYGRRSVWSGVQGGLLLLPLLQVGGERL